MLTKVGEEVWIRVRDKKRQRVIFRPPVSLLFQYSFAV